MPMERMTAQRKPCPCGAGAIRVDITYLDTDWGMRDQSWEGIVECGQCQPLYGFVGAGRGVDLVRIEDKNGSDALRVEAAECEAALLASAEVAAAIEKLAAEIDALPTMAAKYRLARQLEIESITLPTFRKHIRGVPAARWLEWRFLNGHSARSSLSNLIPVMEYAGVDSQPIRDCLAKAEDLRNRAFEVLKPVMSLGPVSMLAALTGNSASQNC
jgi:hypothetical protein